jgi:hypothetical protein
MSIVEKSITDFLSNEYKEFAMYSIEGRAIPSVIDSFKVSQRKIIHISNKIWKTGKEKTIKVFQLCGKVSSDCLHYDSEVLLANGESIKIGDWYTKYPDLRIEVVCVDEKGNTTISYGHTPKSSIQKVVYEIETEDGVIHKLSSNHRVMLSDMSYKKVSELTESDNIFSIC